MIIRYSPTLDRYERLTSNNVSDQLDKWQNGTYFTKNVFRKEEKDWKMVYLCRTERSETGEIHWRFDTDNKLIDTVTLKFNRQVFENGSIDLILCGNDTCVKIPSMFIFFCF